MTLMHAFAARLRGDRPGRRLHAGGRAAERRRRSSPTPTASMPAKSRSPVSDGNIPAYRARPAGKTNAPVVLVVQEIFGVHEHIKDLCRRLAIARLLRHRAVALCALRRSRQIRHGACQDLMTDIVAKVPDAEVMSDLDSTVAFAKARRRRHREARRSPASAGAAASCGSTPRTIRREGRRRLVRPAARPADNASAPAHRDRSGGATCKRRCWASMPASTRTSPPPTSTRCARRWPTAGKTDSRIDVFPDAQHGFNADYRPSYNEKDAKEGWARMLAWFKANGVGVI